MEIITSLGLAYVTYFVGTSSLGPANLAIISTALQHGRSAGISTALGVVTGSMMWGLVSAFGLAALLSALPVLLNVLGLFGGLYLCWLAWGAFRTARLGTIPKLSATEEVSREQQKHFLYGLGLHLTNPKVMFVWMSIIALGIPEGNENRLIPLLIVSGCGVIGLFVFGTYAIVFSNAVIVKSYFRASAAINLLIATVFCVAGLSLIYRSVILFIAL